MCALHNRVNRNEMRQRLRQETFKRTTLSFYRYVKLNDLQELRAQLWREWEALSVFGRIYIAHEGINAQLSVPEYNFETFQQKLYAHPEFANVPFKIAVEDDGKSFFHLQIKIKKKIVADGLPDEAFDVSNVGKHLNAKEFNAAMNEPGTVVVDMRNQYETEVGHFQGAVLPSSDTFKEELIEVLDVLKGQEDKKVLMYCTGGIRCEKASAWLRHHGFKDVNQLYGGIIEYARSVKAGEVESKFIGKNFVFDERLGERITDDIIAKCHQCGAPNDTHVNCANPDCHILFIQCPNCQAEFKGCCSEECREWLLLPIEERDRLKAEGKAVTSLSRYPGQFRPTIGLKQVPPV